MCKLTPFLQGIAVSASVNTLAAIAIDRYLAICHVFEFRVTRKIARMVIALIWFYAAAIMSPWLVYYQQVDTLMRSQSGQCMYVCDQIWPSDEQKRGYFLGVTVVTCYTVPLVFIVVFYTLIGCRVWNRNAPGCNNANTSQVIDRSKKRVVKMLIVVVIMFAFCWLPLYGVNIRLFFGRPLEENSMEFELLAYTVIPVIQWLALSSCSVNPVVYCLFSRKYRNGCRTLIVSIACCRSCANSSAASMSSPSMNSVRFSVTGRETVVRLHSGFSRTPSHLRCAASTATAEGGRRHGVADNQNAVEMGVLKGGSGFGLRVDYRDARTGRAEHMDDGEKV